MAPRNAKSRPEAALRLFRTRARYGELAPTAFFVGPAIVPAVDGPIQTIERFGSSVPFLTRLRAPPLVWNTSRFTCPPADRANVAEIDWSVSGPPAVAFAHTLAIRPPPVALM